MDEFSSSFHILVGRFGKIVQSVDDAIRLVAHEDILWAFC